MFTPGSKRAILRTRILAHPGETFIKSEVCQLSDACPSTAKFVLGKMREAGEVELLMDPFAWRVIGEKSNKQAIEKNGRPSKQDGLRDWLLRRPGEIFTVRQLLKQYSGNISSQTVRVALASMVECSEVIKQGNTSTTTWTVVDKRRNNEKSRETILLELAGLPPLEGYVSRL